MLELRLQQLLCERRCPCEERLRRLTEAGGPEGVRRCMRVWEGEGGGRVGCGPRGRPDEGYRRAGGRCELIEVDLERPAVVLVPEKR